MILRPEIRYDNPRALIISPWYEETNEECKLEAEFFQTNFDDVQMPIKILLESKNNTIWVDLKNMHKENDYK